MCIKERTVGEGTGGPSFCLDNNTTLSRKREGKQCVQYSCVHLNAADIGSGLVEQYQLLYVSRYKQPKNSSRDGG